MMVSLHFCFTLLTILSCSVVVSVEAQQQQHQHQHQQGVPLLTQELFDSLPNPGRYFLKIDPPNCGGRCQTLDPIWAQFANSPMVPVGTVFRVDCGGAGGTNDAFCEKLLGARYKFEGMHKVFNLVVVHFQQEGDITMERYNGEHSLEPLMNWLQEATSSRNLAGESLQSMLAATKFQSTSSEPYGTRSKPNIALLMISTNGLGVRPDIWCHFLSLSIEQKVDIHLFLHDKSDAIVRDGPLCTKIPHQEEVNLRIHRVPTLLTQWGTISLARVIVFLLRSVVAKFGGAERYVIVSDNSVPLVDPKKMLQEITGPGFTSPTDGSAVSVFQDFDGNRNAPVEIERRYKYVRPRYKVSGLQNQNNQSQQQQQQQPLDLSRSDFHVVETWSILDEKSGAWFAENDYLREFEISTSPEEAYFVSLCKTFDLPFRLANPHRFNNDNDNDINNNNNNNSNKGDDVSSIIMTESHGMYTQWPHERTATRPDVLQKITEETTAQWSQKQKHSFLFARKITEQTEIDLPWMKIRESSVQGEL